MKKFLSVLMVSIVIFAAGCESEHTKVPQASSASEDANIKTDTETDAGAENSGSFVTENTAPENNGPEQNNFSDSDICYRLNDYMESVTGQSDIIKASLEQDTLTQADMNMMSQELYELWDDALNYLWDELKNCLPEEEFEKLLDEQLIWIAEKEKAVEEAGKEVEGGSIYPLIVNAEAARITEERVDELYQLLKKSEIQ